MKKRFIPCCFLFICICASFYGLIKDDMRVLSNSLYTLGFIGGVYFANNKFKIFSHNICNLILIFIMMALFGGRSLRFYGVIPYYDKILHFYSGIVIAQAGREIYVKLKGDTSNKVLHNTFAIIFAIALAGLWEIWEFSGDSLIGTNSQNSSLQDTMWDIIAGSISGIISVTASYIYSKFKKYP